MAEVVVDVTKDDKKEAETRSRALEVALAQIEKQFGVGSVMKLGNPTIQNVEVISTGALTLDIALGIGGLPRGRIVEIYGPESSGKTTLALSVAANAQKLGGSVAIIDAEHAIDPKYAERIGVKLDDMLISQPDSGEDGMNIAEMLVRSNAIDVMIVDSVAALVPKAELEGDIGDSHIGLQARLMSQSLRKLTSAVSRSKTCLIFINQLREKIGVMFGNPETTTGGRALKFYASVRLDIRRIAALNDTKGEGIGSRVSVKVAKNKMAAPFKKAEFDIYFNRGISKEASILDVATELNIITKRGTWLSYEEIRLGQGRDQARETLENDKKLTEKLLKLVREKLNLK